MFFVWRRLKEDYSSEIVFSLAVFVLLGLVAGFFASKYLLPAAWFWFEVAGVLAGFGLSAVKFKLKFYETFEAVSLALLIWLSIGWLAVFLITPSVYSFLACLLIILLVVLFFLLDANYKDFTWYKSGRIGFAGFVTLGAFFLTRCAIASFFPTLLSFAPKSEVYLSGSASFIVFLLVYNLSRERK